MENIFREIKSRVKSKPEEYEKEGVIIFKRNKQNAFTKSPPVRLA